MCMLSIGLQLVIQNPRKKIVGIHFFKGPVRQHFAGEPRVKVIIFFLHAVKRGENIGNLGHSGLWRFTRATHAD